MRQREATAEEDALLQQLYTGEVEHVDRALAPFIDELPTPVVVAFTSDHGEALSEHGAWGHGLNLYQEAVHTHDSRSQRASTRGSGAGSVAQPGTDAPRDKAACLSNAGMVRAC